MAETEKELLQLKKRFAELAQKSYRQNVYCFSGFLSLAEQDVFYQVKSEYPETDCTLYGGNDDCERQMARFGSEEQLGYEQPFPIVCIRIKPLLAKFAEELGHRDYLGACMNLGIERSTLGDILVRPDCAYLYCAETISPFIVENLTKIRHTNVRCSVFTGTAETLRQEKIRREYQVSSERVDGVAAKVFGLSRAQILEIFRQKHVFVNGRLQESNSAPLKAGDRVTVRGYGKFVYGGVTHMTRKGKCGIVVELFS